MNKFDLISAYQPTGDQPEAISQLTQGILEGIPAQTLLGVTGSGKTFTVANVIAQINKPTLILSHNKTLAAQLYSEFKSFFPNNAVEYYVSYYDYYQPEAYLPSSDTYIEKDLMINDEIDKLRLAATSALLSGRKDVVVVSSVSCKITVFIFQRERQENIGIGHLEDGANVTHHSHNFHGKEIGKELFSHRVGRSEQAACHVKLRQAVFSSTDGQGTIFPPKSSVQLISTPQESPKGSE